MDAYEILVIILSSALAVFLVLAIIFISLLIKLVKQVRVITSKAEDIVGDVEAASSSFRKAAGAVTFAGLVSNIVDKVSNHNKKGK